MKLLLLLTLLAGPSVSAGPVVTHGINSSRVKPGKKINDAEVIQKISTVKTINVGTISGPHATTFTNAVIASLNSTRQGVYETNAEASAGFVGGMGRLAAVGAKTVVSSAGFVGAGSVGKAGAKAIDRAADGAANRLAGIDRHPEEGFGYRIHEPNHTPTNAPQSVTFKPASVAPSEPTPSNDKVEAKLATAATVAGVVGLGQVQSALEIGKDLKGAFQAFNHGEVRGNSPSFNGVKLPIKAIKEGRGHAQVTATIKRTQDPDKHFKEKRKKKKRDKNGKVVRDKDGKVIWITYEVDCVKRVVHVDVKSKLSLRNGSHIMSARKRGTRTDKKCGKNRMKEIASVESLARPVVKAAGRAWGAFVQPQMQTVRLKLYPTGTSALAVMYMMRNNHTASMCLLDDALQRSEIDPGANYNKAVLLEAYGVYDAATYHYAIAYQQPELATKERFRGGLSRTESRQNALKIMNAAYGMVAKDVSFPFAASCPSIDISGTKATTHRVNMMTAPGGDMVRRLFVGERLRVIGTQKKWAHVQQLDGSDGWVKAKPAFKEKN